MQPPFFVELDTPAVLIGSRFALHTKHRVMSGFFILGARPVRLHGRKIGDVLRHKLHALAPVTLLGRGLRLQARLIARRAGMRAQQLRSDHRAHVCVEVRRTMQGGRSGRMFIGFQASRGRDHVCGRTQDARHNLRSFHRRSCKGRIRQYLPLSVPNAATGLFVAQFE